jgi:hypothetical protein
MPEIRLEARSDVFFELETKLVRGENKTTPHQGFTGVWRRPRTFLTHRERQGKTPGVRKFVERSGDVKSRPGCNAIKVGLRV